MPISPFPLFKILARAVLHARPVSQPGRPLPDERPLTRPQQDNPQTGGSSVRRHFFNMPGFQTYGSFFAHWGGWVSAGHVYSEAGDNLPPFARGPVIDRPGGLDAALFGCSLPDIAPPDPVAGQRLVCLGYPAGSAHIAKREASVYLQRPGLSGQWIAHIHTPDEPVVTGMSGGAVIDRESGLPIGILITRNSPADLNNDRDPDESFDFISLAEVWRAA
ncbi:MAG TPA: serine protease, partial [Hellea balneolensis]|nr:serine protease [Hellea balneolensis]